MLSDLSAKFYRGSQTKEWHAVVNLAHKFKFLRPDALPPALAKLARHRGSASSSGGEGGGAAAPDSLGHAFEAVWRDRTPIEAEIDDLVGESKLTWDNDRVFPGTGEACLEAEEDDGDPFGSPEAKRKRRGGPPSRAHLRSFLGGPAPNPILQQLSAARRRGRKGDVGKDEAKVSLSSCRTVGDVYKNLRRLALPAR